jgi:hypothetical protein
LLKRLDRLERATTPSAAPRAIAQPRTWSTSTRVTSTTNVLVVLVFNAVTVTPAAFANFQFHLDGVNQSNFVFDDMTTARRTVVYTHVFPSLARGSHTFTVRWVATAGTAIAHAGGAMWIIEL